MSPWTKILYVYISCYFSGAGGHNKIASKLRGNPICATSLITREEGASGSSRWVCWVGPSAALHARRRRTHIHAESGASFHLIHSPRAPRAAIFKVSHAQKKSPYSTLWRGNARSGGQVAKNEFRRAIERRTAEAARKFIQMRPFLIGESAYALGAPSRDKTTIYGYVFLKSPPVVLMIAS